MRPTPRLLWMSLALLVLGCEPALDPVEDDPSDTDPAPAQADPPLADAGGNRQIPVGTTVTFTATEATQGEITWDLGDGNLATGREVEHTYTEPGNRLVIQQVIGAGGRRATDTARVTVYLPAADPLPVSASAMVASPDGTYLYVAQPDTHRVVRVHTATQATDFFPTCQAPCSVALVGEVLGVACEDDDHVDRLRASDGHRLERHVLPTGCLPVSIVGRGDTFQVACSGTGEVLALTSSGPPSPSLEIPDPRGLVWLSDDTLLATRYRGNEGFHDRFGPPTGGGLVRIGADELLLVPDAGPDSDTGNRGTPNLLQSVAIRPDGGAAYFGATLANLDRGLAIDGRTPTFETTLRATIRRVDLVRGEEDVRMRVVPDDHGTVSALAADPLGTWVWVALQNTQTLMKLDAFTMQSADTILNAGHGVDALAFSPDGRTLYVHAWLSREVRAYNIHDPGPAQAPLLWSVNTVEQEPLTPEVLRGQQLFYDAFDQRLARDGYLSCAACHPFGTADGLTWDFTHRGEGFRNTTWLLGRAGTGHGPVHWTGNFDEIHDFEGDIRNQQEGRGLLSDADWEETQHPLGPPKAGRSADLDALAAYVTSLDRFPVSPHTAPEGGEEAFLAAGCGDCHDPATEYTDSTLTPDPADYIRHDVGTWRPTSGERLAGCYDGFDTPTLLGTWQTGPYLHDGRAETIEDAIRAHRPVADVDPDCEAERGPITSAYDATSLSDAQIDLIADFVRSL